MYQVLISNIFHQIPEDLHLKYLIPIKKPCLSTYMIDYNTPPMTRIREEIWKNPLKCSSCPQRHYCPYRPCCASPLVCCPRKCKPIPYRPDHPGYCVEGKVALQRIHEMRPRWKH